MILQAVWRRIGVAWLLAAVAAGVILAAGAVHLTTATLHAQQQFELFIAAIHEETSQPATDLTMADVVMEENGQRGRVVRMEPFSLPVRLTVLVDNGRGTASSLVHYRNGLRALLETLPGDLEVEVIAMAPNPRFLARRTGGRAEVLRSPELLVPDDAPAKFASALAEYGARLEREFKGDVEQARQAYMPVLVALSTAGLDGSEVRRDDVINMANAFVRYGVRTYIAMVSQRERQLEPGTEGGFQPTGLELYEGSQIFVAQAVQELTKGQYEALAISSRAATLLPEWGKQIAMTHRAGTNQYRLTLERPAGATGALTNLGMYIEREGYAGVVTVDGRVP